MEKWYGTRHIFVCKDYAQEEEGIYYGQIFTHMGRLEGVRTILAHATYKKFKVYKMDVKSTSMN